LDTRSKIKPLKGLDSLAAGSKWVAVAGFFDPLTATQANRLADAARNRRHVLAIVLTDPDCLLPADARAVLVAAVRDVTTVVIADADRWRSAIPEHTDITIIDDLEADRKRSEEFAQYILQRQVTSKCPSL
jgi:hypothetical protein